MENLTPQQAEELAQQIQDMVSPSQKIAELFAAGKNELQAQNSIMGELKKNSEEELNIVKEKIKKLKETNSISDKEALLILKNIKKRSDELDPLRKKQELLRINKKLQQEENELKKEHGNIFQKIHAKVKEASQNKSEVLGNLAKQAYENPMGGIEDQIMKFNPLVGAIVKIVVDLIDKFRKMSGELQASDAAAGNFGDSIEKYQKMAYDMFGAGGKKAFSNLRLNADEAGKVIQTLNRTGVLSIKDVSKAWGEGIDSIGTATVVFAKASGETEEIVSQRLASIMRNFRASTPEQATKIYKRLLDDAQTVAKRGTITTSEYLQTVMSLSEAFSDMGMDVGGVSKMVRGLHLTLGALKVPSKVISEVANGLMSLSKVSDEWASFIGMKSGGGNDFLSSLGNFQQRGPNFETAALSGGNFDIGKTLKDTWSTLKQSSMGAGGINEQRYLMEQIGKQMGLSPNMVGALKKIEESGMSTEDQGKTFEALKRATLDNVSSTKDLATLLKDWIQTYIFQPLMGIWKAVEKVFGGAADTYQSKIDKTEFENNSLKEQYGFEEPKQYAAGGIVDTTAKYMLHRKEEVLTPADPRHRNQSKNGNNPVNLNISVVVNNGQIKEAFREAEQRTLRELANQHRVLFGR